MAKRSGVRFAEFGLFETAIGEHRQDITGMGDAAGVDIAENQCRRFSARGDRDAERIDHHAVADIALAAFSDRDHIGSVLERPRRDEHLPMSFLERPLDPGCRQHEHVCSIEHQTARQLGKAHIVAGHQTDLETRDVNQRGHVEPGVTLVDSFAEKAS